MFDSDSEAMTIPRALAFALELRAAGEGEAAADVLAQVLAADPAQADAHHVLGVLAMERGALPAARAAIARAIAIAPDRATYHNSLAVADSIDDYVDRAVRLATDRALNAGVRARLLAASEALFCDEGAVSEH